MSKLTSWSDKDAGGGWYAVTGKVKIDSVIEVSGDVNMILCDGAALTANGSLIVPGGSLLTVRGQGGKYTVPRTSEQTFGTGTLFAKPADIGDYFQSAAIGGRKNGTAGKITINRGVITVNGNWGAGIGEGDAAVSSGTVEINGGCVTASGNNGSAGIGGVGYSNGCDVTITGGYVTATGSAYNSHAAPA